SLRCPLRCLKLIPKRLAMLTPIVCRASKAPPTGLWRGKSLGARCLLQKQMRQPFRAISHRLLLSPIQPLLSLCSSLRQGMHEGLGRQRRGIVEDRLFHCILASAREVGITEPMSRFHSGSPIDCTAGEGAEFSLHRLLRLTGNRGREFKYIIEPAEQSMIEHLRMVCSRDDQASRLVLFEELEERVEHAPDLADIVRCCAVPANRVEFIEEVY